MIDRLKEFLRSLHDAGVPLPLLSDHGVGSVSLTMYWISFLLCVIGIIGKYSKVLDVDIQQALYLYGVCAAMYYGKKARGNAKTGEIEIDNEKKE